MPLTTEQRAGVEFVVRQLEAQRQQKQQLISDHQSQINDLNSQVRDLNTSIATVSRTLDPDTTSKPHVSSRSDKYASLSVRWAILDLLSNSPAMSTAEISDALIAAGIESRAANFANNVSAVLSTSMKERHDEVRQLGDGKWELTETGRRAIEHIRTLPKFRLGNQRGRSPAKFYGGGSVDENTQISRR
jgi:hypothetical protein